MCCWPLGSLPSSSEDEGLTFVPAITASNNYSLALFTWCTKFLFSSRPSMSLYPTEFVFILKVWSLMFCIVSIGELKTVSYSSWNTCSSFKKFWISARLSLAVSLFVAVCVEAPKSWSKWVLGDVTVDLLSNSICSGPGPTKGVVLISIVWKALPMFLLCDADLKFLFASSPEWTGGLCVSELIFDLSTYMPLLGWEVRAVSLLENWPVFISVLATLFLDTLFAAVEPFRTWAD